MALQRELVLPSGIILHEAYSRIKEFFYDRDGHVGMKVANYIDKQAADDPTLEPISEDTYTIRDVDIYEEIDGQDVIVQYSQFQEFFTIDKVSGEGRNQVSQGYEFLKTLPDYAGAINV